MVEQPDRLEAALADRYAIEREIGHGGMARVYLARDLKHNRPVAIKVLKSELSASLASERFLAEIEITANLHHPHILPLHDSGEADGRLFFVMPYVEGESLEDRIEREGPLEVGEAVTIAREVADALAYAHERGVVHRDIKPGNLLLVAGHAVVADFGIARAATEAGAPGPSGTGLVGSPAYMSPEQISEEEVDGRADIYALGCVLYEMLTGEPPYPAKGLAVFASHLEDEVPSARERRGEVWEELDAAVERALAKSPVDRHPTAGEFGETLKSAARGEALRRHGTLPATLITYGAGGWLLYQGIGWATAELFMPDWVRAGALGLLLIGLPVFLTTALLHRRVRLRRTRAHRLFSWRNAFAGGVAAFVTLGLGAGGFLASRALGIGPAASLVAQGLLEERDPLILADFGGTDSVLARTATEALRIDLSGSRTVTLISPRAQREALTRMRQDPNQPFDPELARELAVREGVKGVISGQVNTAGSTFLLTMQLVTPEDGTPLVSDRETAAGPDQFIGAIDKLSKRLRSRVGEPLGSIRASPGLARVTTPSLDALKAFTAGWRIYNQGDSRAALTRFEEAIALDSTFAIAWRAVGNLLGNRGEEWGRRITAITKAFELREELPEEERVAVEMQYHLRVTGRSDLVVEAEEKLAEIRGGVYGLNLGTVYRGTGDHARAEEALYAAIENGSPGSFGMLSVVYVDQGRLEDAARILDRLEDTLPGNHNLALYRPALAAARGQWKAAADLYREHLSRDDSAFRVDGLLNVSQLEAIQGRMSEAERAAEEILATHQRRGLGGDYLSELVRLAELDVWVSGDRARALERLRTGLDIHPLSSLYPHDRPYEALARAFAVADEPREARRLLAAFESEIEPKHLARVRDHTWALAQAAYAEGDAAEALSQLDRGEEIRTGGLLFLQTLPLRGRAYEMAGQQDSALAVYERYVATTRWGRHRWDDLYLAWVTERLGQLYDERGDLDKAALYYAKFAELWAGADEGLQPRVRAAQARLEEILAERG